MSAVGSGDPRWTMVREELARIQEAPASARPDLLASLDESLRTEVASLLAASERVPGFLRLPEDTHVEPGTSLGPYRLVDEIGRGGMGVVFRAERRDGEFARQVAIKVAGERTFGPDAERRFIQERQILAQLEHPHIVRLLDGGITDGRRYFVMELVTGTPITDYCTARALPLSERLDLFRRVCSAIHYAHQRLILHRDLKPANVIVTDDGDVKVLDFGIAQILLGDGTTSDTSTMLHPFSLGCASPEQLRGEPLSLASDVYSLGVLLYELVTLQNPQHRANETFDDTYRRVVETGLPAPRTIARVPKDLEAIVMKSTSRHPADRYPSVSELQADVERWLAHRPVLARAPSGLYVLSTLVRRHKAVSAMTATFVALLTIGAVVFVRQARIEQRRFEDARRLINVVVQEIQPKLESIPATLPLRQTLIERTMTYLESVSRDAGNNVELLRELANAYAQLARVQGDISTSTLGNQAAATERFRRAEALMRRAATLAPSDPAVAKDAALFYGRLAVFDNAQGRANDSFIHASQAAEYGERNLALRPGEFDAREVFAFSVFYLAFATPPEQWDARVSTFRRAGDLYRQLAKELPSKENLRRNVAITDRYLAGLHHDKGRSVEALTFGARALAAQEEALASKPGDPPLQLEAATDAGQLGMFADTARQFDEGLTHYQRAIALDEAVLKADPANARAKILLAEATRNLARNRLQAGDSVEARRQVQRALDVFDALRKAGQFPAVLEWRYATATATLGDIEQSEGHGSPACDAYGRALAAFDASDRQSPLVDLVKADADRTRAQAARCPPSPASSGAPSPAR